MNKKREYVYMAEKRILVSENRLFEKQSSRILSRKEDVIVMDFSETKIIDSEGLKNLLNIQERLEELGKKFKICNVSSFLMEIMDVTGYSKKFNIEHEEGIYIAPIVIDRYNYQKVEEEILEVIKISDYYVLVDLKNTKKITFEGLAILLKADKIATKNNIHLILHNVSESLLQMIYLYKFQNLFTMTLL